MQAYKQQDTGVLWGDAGIAGSDSLPRSIASDGRRSVLILHVLVHLVALASNIVFCVFFLGDFVQTMMKTGAIVAVDGGWTAI